MNRPEFEFQHVSKFYLSQYVQSPSGTTQLSVPLLLGSVTEGKTAEA
jgi:hypothetical protein